MKLYPTLSEDLSSWAQKQPVFFAASAPTHGAHINVSPKGLSAHFAVLSPTQCAYIDRTGSGCETISHAYENGRLTLMFMSFGPAPRILRLFCRSVVVEHTSSRFADLVRTIAAGKRDAFDGARAVILCSIFQVQTSCGYGVPMVRRELYAREKATQEDEEDDDDNAAELAVFADRPTLDLWATKTWEAKKTRSYQAANNARSMDGLPGLRVARRDAGEWVRAGDIAAWARRVLAEKSGVAFGFFLAVFTYVCLSAAFGFGAASEASGHLLFR